MIASHYHRYIFSVAESYRQKTDTSELIVKSKHKNEKETRTTHAYQNFFFIFWEGIVNFYKSFWKGRWYKMGEGGGQKFRD